MDWHVWAILGGVVLTLLLMIIGASVFQSNPAFDPSTDGVSESSKLAYYGKGRKNAAFAFFWTAGAWAVGALTAATAYSPDNLVIMYVIAALAVLCLASLIAGGLCLRSARSLSQRHLYAVANEQMAVVLNVLGQK